MASSERKPEWLKVRLPGGEQHARLRDTFRRLGLHTVCEEARCPNVGECWHAGTATLMILGDVCTRGCRFCAVRSGDPGGELDASEPLRVAEALSQLDLLYVVVTMVDRDDLRDGGAGQVAATVTRIRERCPDLRVEALVSDFAGVRRDVETVVREGRPDVYAHNVEVVPSLTRKMRDARCSFERSLSTLRFAREAGAKVTKSSLMVGCGESPEDVREAMRLLRGAEVDVLTIGQYLQPTPRHAPVVRYVEPAELSALEREGLAMGFKHVAAGPLVRSSYRAAEAFMTGILRGGGAPPADRYGKKRLSVVR